MTTRIIVNLVITSTQYILNLQYDSTFKFGIYAIMYFGATKPTARVVFAQDLYIVR